MTIDAFVHKLQIAALCAFAALAAVAEDRVPQQPEKHTLYLVGASTLDEHMKWIRSNRPYASWGRALEPYLKDGWRIDNNAYSGRSVKSTLEGSVKEANGGAPGGLWALTADNVRSGDYVIIQFGHNDQKFFNKNAFSAPGDGYKKGLSKMVADVRAKGGIPVFATSIRRATFDAEGKRLVEKKIGNYVLGDYAKAMIELGREIGVDVVDMHSLVAELLESLGRKESEKFYMISTGIEYSMDGEPSRDVTHPVKAGADAFARLFYKDVMRRRLRMSEIFKPVACFAREDELLLEPTFCSCSVEFGANQPIEGLRLEWRKASGGEWRSLPEREWKHRPVSRTYRASIRVLEEDTRYEVRLTAHGQVVKSGSFRTWKSDVPIVRTIELTAGGPLPKTISDKGTADGWIRYTTAPGVVIDFGDGAEDAVEVDGAQYVVFDGMRIRGTRGRRVFKLTNCRHVRIRNCDISRWGRVGTPRFDLCGRIYAPGMSDSEYGINFDAAIEIGEGCFGVVVERCWIHDPRGRANSWYYSHPAGPEAVALLKPLGSTVIRWNDFVGSDVHRFNDAVEGAGNFRENGGFNRDADIYGNFMAFCNDDCIELDGGQRNVRCFGNRFEAALCGVSVQGCMVGPSYVCNNLFSGMCGEFGEWGQTVKTGGGRHGPEAEVFLDDNFFWGDGYGIEMRTNLTVRSMRNVFAGRQRINHVKASPASTSEGDVFGKTVSECELDASYPLRPMALSLEAARFSGFKVRGGVPEPSEVVVRARSAGRESRFKIEKNEVFDWLEVSPSEGIVPADGEVALTVRLDPAKMKDRRWYRGAFLARAADGFSRPFTVYAETDFKNPYFAERSGDKAVYVCGFKEGDYASFGEEGRVFGFSVPSAGRWYLMLHGIGAGEVTAAVDDDEPQVSRQQGRDYPTWTMLAPGRRQGNMMRPYDLAPGAHKLLLRNSTGAFRCDGVVVAKNPLEFEPK